MDFGSVFELLIRQFQEKKVDFALIGGFALPAAGYVRATNDIDFLVDKDQMPTVREIMASYGYRLLHQSDDASNFLGPVSVLGGVDFLHAHRRYAKAMLARAVKRDVLEGKVQAKVVLPEDLIGLKVQSSSNDPERYHQDMADIEAIIKINFKNLNREWIREYFGLFNRVNEFEEILKRLNHAH